MKKKLFNLFRFSLTFILLLFIFYQIDFIRLKVAFYYLDFQLFIIGCAYFIIYPFVGIGRWQYMINCYKPLSFILATRIYYIGESINLFLPAKAGDLSKAVYLNRMRGVSLVYGASSVLFEKLLDLLAICFIFLFGWFYNGMADFEYMPSLFSFIFLVIAIFILFLFVDKFLFIKKYINRFNSIKISDAFKDFQLFVGHIKKDNFRLLLFILISILFWLGHCLQIHLFFRAVNINITYIDTIMIMPITFIISLLPFTIAGFGTREAALMLLLSSYAPNENILAGCILLSLRYFIPALIGLFFWQDMFFKKVEK